MGRREIGRTKGACSDGRSYDQERTTLPVPWEYSVQAGLLLAVPGIRGAILYMCTYLIVKRAL